MPSTQMKKGLAVLLLLAALLDNAACTSTIIKVPPIKPGEINQTIYVNMPPTVDVVRDVQIGNDTSARIYLPPQAPAGGDCLLSDCDENDVGCDGLPPCGPYCPPEACSRVDCSQCMQAGFRKPCCWSCCSQYTPYPYPQQPPPARTVYPQPLPQPLPQPIPYPQTMQVAQPQAIPIPQPQAIPIPQAQPIPIPQPQPIPIAQPQPIPIPQPQPIPVPQPQPIPIPQPRPYPFPISVPQPYPVPQPIPYPQIQLQPRPQPQPYPATYYMPQQCRQVQTWPFLQCGQPSNCMWYQPGCIPQPTWPNPCYTGGSC